jgi:hypothetical protein
LASFFIEQARNDEIEGEHVGENSSKGNDKEFISYMMAEDQW